MRKQKMSKRLAKKLLEERDCEVKLDSEYFDDNIYHTRHDDYFGDDVIYIKELGNYQDVEFIKEIRYIDGNIDCGFIHVNW